MSTSKPEQGPESLSDLKTPITPDGVRNARPYTAPRLVTLGTLTALTSGGTGAPAEGMLMILPTRHP